MSNLSLQLFLRRQHRRRRESLSILTGSTAICADAVELLNKPFSTLITAERATCSDSIYSRSSSKTGCISSPRSFWFDIQINPVCVIRAKQANDR
ncbi:hypothetical protein CCR75_001814 [Bremia lactucae]|uniref:Uncharacterized protein n=1 Tax=Bremia lactucae TaxID=4779 RepID=A0A976FF94_BRELC|nr:hypothetical protein CCR75_001817 [Bremia lactucae]TDH65631.1 hypothetical protein CCR75_001814 [Bremia lactucae]